MMAAGAVRTCRELSLEAITESFADPEELVQAVMPMRPVPVVQAAAICNSFTVQAVGERAPIRFAIKNVARDLRAAHDAAHDHALLQAECPICPSWGLPCPFPSLLLVLSSSSVVGQRMAVSLGVERSNRLVDGA